MRKSSSMLKKSVAMLFICFLSYSSFAQQKKPVSCDQFFKESKFYLKNIERKVVLGITDINEFSYRITYDEGPGVKKFIDVYLNVNGKSLRNYLQPGDILKKDKEDVFITVARIVSDSMDVQRFDLSCN